MTTTTVSALVVARNEENRIETCIASAACADEIVVLLDRSEDATGDIARRMGARVVEGDWEDEGARRTAGISACTGDWILELDADERISRALAGELRTLTESDAADYYVIPFHNHFGGKWIRYGWGPITASPPSHVCSVATRKNGWADPFTPESIFQAGAVTRPVTSIISSTTTSRTCSGDSTGTVPLPPGTQLHGEKRRDAFRLDAGSSAVLSGPTGAARVTGKDGREWRSPFSPPSTRFSRT